jgi:hypothetical protein
MRFLSLELDGRTTLDRTRQGLYGVVMGQAAAVARPLGAAPKRQGAGRISVSGSVRRYLRPQSAGRLSSVPAP